MCQDGRSCVRMACHVSGWHVTSQDGMSCVRMACHVSGWHVTCQDGMSCVRMACHVSRWHVMCQDGMSCVKMACGAAGLAARFFALMSASVFCKRLNSSLNPIERETLNDLTLGCSHTHHRNAL